MGVWRLSLGLLILVLSAACSRHDPVHVGFTDRLPERARFLITQRLETARPGIVMVADSREANVLVTFTASRQANAVGRWVSVPVRAFFESEDGDRSAPLQLVPFNDLDPRWRVLPVDGFQPLSKQELPPNYPFVEDLVLSGSPADTEWVTAALGEPITNRDLRRLTALALTGTTALTRLTAQLAETKGPTYLGSDIRELLRGVDLVHISNEVSFSPGYRPVVDRTLIFGSNDSYLSLFDDLGVKGVELTGNHLFDIGETAFLHTLDLYQARGWHWFGGGRNLAEAQAPWFVADHGNRLALIGRSASFSAQYAGNARSGPAYLNLGELFRTIDLVKRAGFLPIVSIQFKEEYQLEPTSDQAAVFRAIADRGAVIVQGSQAHQPQAFELRQGRFIHYGLGNLFFDQMWSQPTRQGLIDIHWFYDNRHLGVSLTTTVIEEYGRPRITLGAERQELLNALFQGSYIDGKLIRTMASTHLGPGPKANHP